MAEVIITVDDWRAAFPEFANIETYPDAYLQRFLTMATAFISTRNFRLRPSVRILAIQLMAAHLLTLAHTDAAGNAINTDGTAGTTVTSASIDGVSVSMQAPLAGDAFAQWIQTTPYGRQLWALLTVNNPTGVFYVGTPRLHGIR